MSLLSRRPTPSIGCYRSYLGHISLLLHQIFLPHSQGTIPLHLAAQNGQCNVASLLLSKSSHQIHIKDNRGRTPLHLAAAHGTNDMVALLLGQGADINAGDTVRFTP